MTLTATSEQPQTREHLDKVSRIEELRDVVHVRRWWALVLAAGLLGVVSGVWQTVDRIAFAADNTAASFCDINAVFSCASVFQFWQSSALGIPNSLIGIPVFAALASAGLAGVTGAKLSRSYLLAIGGMSLFMTGFITWYMAQSAFAIGVLCLFCAACAVSTTMAGIGLTRVLAREEALGSGRAGRQLRLLVDSGADVIAWVGLLALIAVMLWVGLAW